MAPMSFRRWLIADTSKSAKSDWTSSAKSNSQRRLMTEPKQTTVQQPSEEQPKLRDKTMRPEGTIPKQAQTYVITGVSVVILLAVMFSTQTRRQVVCVRGLSGT